MLYCIFYCYYLLLIADIVLQEVLQYENFDLETIKTPVNIPTFEKLLRDSKYDAIESEFLLQGFKNGFSIGYAGPENVKIISPNLKFREVGNPTILWNKVMKEVKEKRYAGPFDQIPFEHYIQSPIGLVPKDGGRDTRLIFHLSYPRGKGTSVNENTPESLCSVKYPDFNEAVQLCIREGKGCHISKSDMKSVFRNLGICKRHWQFLVMKATSPIDGKTYYFVDKCLPFGASISCSISNDSVMQSGTLCNRGPKRIWLTTLMTIFLQHC